ncbi:MAG TPA: D-alanyl-D-alanine carboxypeptidase [Firmicutes bacterium]|jgi:D-alanyl-D-alanine carboxypeptidase (penicillin-binding protein 5/6)|nr:D-alanyl-D-alanine carboxypeptidase [Bacillota bacterium]
MLKKKLVLVILNVVIVPLLFSFTAKAEFESAADAAVLMEFASGNILYEKNAAVAKPPASITKLMTLLLAFEAIDEGTVTWETPVMVSEKAWRMGGSQMFLEVGDEVSFKDLVTGISVVSANDACVAVAEHLAGSEAVFVENMNAKAKEIGLQHTTFKNATGLSAEGHVMSPLDIAILSRYLITNYSQVLEFESQREFTYNDIKQYNRNPLLGSYSGADGLKTGWTEEAGYCLSATAEREGMRLIAVILNTDSERERLVAAEEILDYGFLNYQLHEAVAEGQIIQEVPVANGRQLTVPVKAATKVAVPLRKTMIEDLEQVVIVEDGIKAPIEKGETLGKLEIKLAGEVVGETELVAAEDVSRANIFVRFFRWLLSLIRIRPAA